MYVRGGRGEAEEAKRLLGEIVRVILRNAAIEPVELIRRLLRELGLPAPPIPSIAKIAPDAMAKVLGDIVAKTVPSDAAERIVEEVEEILARYRRS